MLAQYIYLTHFLFSWTCIYAAESLYCLQWWWHFPCHKIDGTQRHSAGLAPIENAKPGLMAIGKCALHLATSATHQRLLLCRWCRVCEWRALRCFVVVTLLIGSFHAWDVVMGTSLGFSRNFLQSGLSFGSVYDALNSEELVQKFYPHFGSFLCPNGHFL